MVDPLISLRTEFRHRVYSKTSQAARKIKKGQITTVICPYNTQDCPRY